MGRWEKILALRRTLLFSPFYCIASVIINHDMKTTINIPGETRSRGSLADGARGYYKCTMSFSIGFYPSDVA